MATTLIGTLRPHAKGVHVQANAYNIMDVVLNADGSRAYMAIKDVPAGTAITDTAYWCIFTDLSAVKAAMEQATQNTDNALAGLEGRVDDMVASGAEAIANLTDYTSEYALRVRGEIGHAEGNPVTVTPDAGSLLQPVTVIDVTQQGEGEPSPDNIRPFIGYDALSLVRCGKNLFGGEALADKLVEVTGSAVKNTENKTIRFAATGHSGSAIYSDFKANTQYTIILYGNNSYGATHPNLQINYTDGSINTPLFETGGVDSYAILQTNPAKTIKSLEIVEYGWFTTLCYDKCGIFEGAISLEDFEPYQDDVYTVQIGETVYSGRMNWLAGEMVVDRTRVVCDGTQNMWFNATNDYGLSVFLIQIPESSSNWHIEKSNWLPTRYSYNSDFESFFVRDAGIYVTIDPARLSSNDVDGFAAYLKSNPLEVTYETATPRTIQLAPQQIQALKPEGVNTLYGDGTTIELEWVKPLATSIADHTAPLIERIAALEAAIINH